MKKGRIIMNNKIMTKASLLINRTGLKIRKHSPEILMVAGIVGTVASTVLACKATTKVSEIMKNKEDDIKQVHECEGNEEFNYTEEDKNKDLTIIYTHTAISLVKLYAPAVMLGTLSIASIVSGQKILKKRNIALAAAYTAVDKGFKKYRENVVERFGNEVDYQLRHNIKAKEIEETVIDKKGKEKVEKKTVYEIEDPLKGISEYARFFDCESDEHRKDPEYNLMFLRRQQDYANEMLKHRGYLFLNEVYEMLGLPRTQAGQVVGWLYDEKNPNGDNYVDFGIYDLNGSEQNNERKMAFVNGYEYNILLDFNVDGVIYDKM
jgi:hypothetical protein